MASFQELKENTDLIDRYFPINIFRNQSHWYGVLGIHWHENIEIIYMLQGEADFNIGGQTVSARPGDILFVNSGLLHTGYNKQEGTLVEYYAIVFNKALLASHTPDPHHIKYITPFLEDEIHFPLKVEKGQENYPLLQEVLLKAIDEFSGKAPGYEIMIKAYFQHLTVSIFRYFCLLDPAKKLPEIYDKNIENIKKLITHVEKHYDNKISIEEAAGFVNLSSFYFCKTFKKITGRTFVEFLNLYRVNKAEELLRSTQLPITDIAEKVGFCNINYFDRIFKQAKQYPPSACRK
jgi:AraC family transcriptional regulator, transcriptional activator of pobA